MLDRLPTGVNGGCSGALDEFRCGWKATPAASFVADVISLIIHGKSPPGCCGSLLSRVPARSACG